MCDVLYAMPNIRGIGKASIDSLFQPLRFMTQASP